MLESNGENGQIWYRYGSKLDDGNTAAAIQGLRFRKTLPMKKYPSVFQTIEICMREYLKRRTTRTAIPIIYDSHAALLALKTTREGPNVRSNDPEWVDAGKSMLGKLLSPVIQYERLNPLKCSIL